MLFLPGTLCDARVWDGPCKTLRHDWPCVNADYRFETSIAAMAAEALAEVDGSIIPIGLSMGGIVALDIWRQAQDRVIALALFDTDPGADKQERRAKRDGQVKMAVRGNFLEMIESQLLPAYFSAAHSTDALLHAPDASLRDTVVTMALDHGAEAFAAQATALATRPNAWPLLESINVPALIACGADDRICLPETHIRMAARLPLGTTTFRSIAAAGHLSPLEQPEATTRVLQTWLDSLPLRNGCWPRKSA